MKAFQNRGGMAIKVTEFLKEFNERARETAEEIEAIIDTLFEDKKFHILDNGDVMFKNVHFFYTNKELDKKIFEIVKDTFLANGWDAVELVDSSSIILRHKSTRITDF